MVSIHLKRFAVVVTVLVALVGCSGGDKKDDEEAKKSATTTSLPKECEGVDLEGDEPIPGACSDAVFTLGVTENGSKALKKFSKEQQLGFGHGLCAYANALAENPDQAPSYSDLVKSTAKSWEASEDVVEEVLNNAAALCPGDLEPILKLRNKTGSVTVEMSVTASGEAEAEVTYTLPNGDNFQDKVKTPWEHEVVLKAPSDFRLGAKTAEGEVSCSLTVKGKEVISATNKDGAEVVCEASTAQINAAAR